jgi:organic radical activating enzyme
MGIQLQIETTNVCNAECVFCPYPTMERRKGLMSLDLSAKILCDAADIPQIDAITFTGLGEPLLDRHLERRIHFAKKLRPNWLVDVYTNGSYLTKQRADALAETGLDVLYVSLNAANRQRRLDVMKLGDYDTVVAQTRYAMDLGAYRVIVKAISNKDLMEQGDTDEFMQQWGGPTVHGGSAFLHLEGNWAGDTWKARTPQRTPCSRALTQIMVLWDGRVSLCCFDGEGKEILGDLNSQSLREVYNGPRALGIREAHNEGRRSEIPICAGCTAI